VIDNGADAVLLLESVALAVKFAVPAAVGEPETTPALDKASPYVARLLAEAVQV
jgi:hypothetical protein